MDNGGKGGKRTEKETQDEVPGMRELEDRTKRKKNNPRFVIRTLPDFIHLWGEDGLVCWIWGFFGEGAL